MRYVEIGTVPNEENCAQTGSKKYDADELQQIECNAYIAAIKRVHGDPPEGSQLRVSAQKHDFGTYHEVRYYYRETNDAHAQYADKVQDGLATWFEGRTWPPVTYDEQGNALNVMRDPAAWSMDDNPAAHPIVRQALGEALGNRDPDRRYLGIVAGTRATGMRWDVMLKEKGTVTRLPPRYDVYNHSESFAWGYGGSGPAQTALAILCDAIGPERARLLYHDFKWQKIAPLPCEVPWEMTAAEVSEWADAESAASSPSIGI